MGMNVMEAFKQRLKELREEAGVSMQKLADAVGVSSAAVCKWENGLAEPKVYYIVKLADFFNCSADYILGRADDFGAVVSPEADEALKLTKEERQLIADYRMVSPELKSMMKNFITSAVNLQLVFKN